MRPSQTKTLKLALGDSDDPDVPHGLGATLMKYYSAVSHGTLWGVTQSLKRVPGSNTVKGALGVVQVTAEESMITLAALIYGYAVAVNPCTHWSVGMMSAGTPHATTPFSASSNL